MTSTKRSIEFESVNGHRLCIGIEQIHNITMYKKHTDGWIAEVYYICNDQVRSFWLYRGENVDVSRGAYDTAIKLWKETLKELEE